jgi:hypothetical protein
MAYAASVYSNLRSLWLKFWYSLSWFLKVYEYSPQHLSFPKLQTYLRFQHNNALYPLPHLIS